MKPHTVHISGGQFKGLRLNVPPQIRATGSKVRQALFNILSPVVDGARVLDGFAGSGALGLEALSRGARYVAFIDSEPDAVIAIRDNLARMGQEVPPNAWRVVHAPIDRGLRHLAELEQPFDIILLDPPYQSREGKKALNTVVECVMLAPAGIVALEHDQRTMVPSTIGPLRQQKRHRYGDTVLSLYWASVS